MILSFVPPLEPRFYFCMVVTKSTRVHRPFPVLYEMTISAFLRLISSLDTLHGAEQSEGSGIHKFLSCLYLHFQTLWIAWKFAWCLSDTKPLGLNRYASSPDTSLCISLKICQIVTVLLLNIHYSQPDQFSPRRVICPQCNCFETPTTVVLDIDESALFT